MRQISSFQSHFGANLALHKSYSFQRLLIPFWGKFINFRGFKRYLRAHSTFRGLTGLILGAFLIFYGSQIPLQAFLALPRLFWSNFCLLWTSSFILAFCHRFPFDFFKDISLSRASSTIFRRLFTYSQLPGQTSSIFRSSTSVSEIFLP